MNNEETKIKFKYSLDAAKLPSIFIKPVIGSLNSRKLASKYPIVNIKDNSAREFLMDWLEENNFLNTLKKTFYTTSFKGGAYLAITKLGESWKLILTRNVVIAAKDATDELIELITFTKLIKGNRTNYWIYEKFTKGKIQRVFKKTDAGLESDFKTAFENGDTSNADELKKDANVIIDKEIDTKGIMCAFYVANQYNTLDEESIYGPSDTAYAVPEIDLLDDAWVSLKRAMRVVNPRLLLIKDEGGEITYVSDVKSEDSNSNVTEKEEEQLLDANIIVLNNSPDFDAKGGNFNAFIPNPQVVEYAQKQFEKAYSAVLQRAGFAGADDADSAQKSILEVSQIRDSEFAAMEDKISIFQHEAKKIIRAIGKLLNLNISKSDGIEIQKLDVRAEVEMIDNLVKAVSAGFEERAVAIARYKGISQTEAETVMRRIDEAIRKKEGKLATGEARKLEEPEKEVEDD